MKADVIVIGAGAVGAAIAYELLLSNRSVVLLDRDQPEQFRPSATSWAGAGILPPANFRTATDPIDRLRGLSHQRFPTLAEELQEVTGIDCELDRCGGWYLADTPGEIGAMTGMMLFWQELGIDCETHRWTNWPERSPRSPNGLESASVRHGGWKTNIE